MDLFALIPTDPTDTHYRVMDLKAKVTRATLHRIVDGWRVFRAWDLGEFSPGLIASDPQTPKDFDTFIEAVHYVRETFFARP